MSKKPFIFIGAYPIETHVDLAVRPREALLAVLSQDGYDCYAVAESVNPDFFRTDLAMLEKSDIVIVAACGNLYHQARIGLYIGYAHARGIPIFIYSPFSHAEFYTPLTYPALGSTPYPAYDTTEGVERVLEAVEELTEINQMTVTEDFAEAVARFQDKWKM